MVLVCIGISGYRWIEGMGLVDAFYMTVITISTVGFNEVKPLSSSGRLFTVSLILGGAGVAAYTLSSASEFLISGEWRAHWEHQRRTRMLAKLSNHTIVCGYGRVGRHVVHALKTEGRPFVVIDPDSEKISHIQQEGYPALLGNAAIETKLKEAGIDRASGMVVAANSDAENVFIVLTARSLRNDLQIVARANYEESEQKLLKAGANRVLMPYRLTGRRMVTMLVRPNVADFLDEVSHASGLELLLEQIYIAATSPLVGKTLAEAELGRRLGITVLAYKTENDKLNARPEADTILEANAQIIVLGTREQLQELMKLAKG